MKLATYPSVAMALRALRRKGVERVRDVHPGARPQSISTAIERWDDLDEINPVALLPTTTGWQLHLHYHDEEVEAKPLVVEVRPAVKTSKTSKNRPKSAANKPKPRKSSRGLVVHF